MSVRESPEAAAKRWHDLELLQEYYAEFSTFLEDVIVDFMGFNFTDIQKDIGEWVAYGPQYRMVQAQRGQAKTTITAAYAAWRCIQNPSESPNRKSASVCRHSRVLPIASCRGR